MTDVPDQQPPAPEASEEFSDDTLVLLAGCSNDYWARHGSEARALAARLREAERERDEALHAAKLRHPATAGLMADYQEQLVRRAEAAEDRVRELGAALRRLATHHERSWDEGRHEHPVASKCRVVHDIERLLGSGEGQEPGA